jgi:MPBQ/MSBQ methyltransferase
MAPSAALQLVGEARGLAVPPAHRARASQRATRRTRAPPPAAAFAAGFEAAAAPAAATAEVHAARGAAQPVAELARAPAVAAPAPPAPALPPRLPAAAAAAAALALAALAAKRVLDTPSRAYDANVGEEYDAWTEEGVLEYFWGEHIHLGYYSTDAQRRAIWRGDKEAFVDAKLVFVDEMLGWSGADLAPPGTRVLDVGCGIGGTSRHLAARHPAAAVTGITLSPKQRDRAAALAAERGLGNVDFCVMDALAMDFPDASFDVVWACESGEHMPDKGAYVREMARVLRPGGTLVLATWCQREETPAAPLSADDRARLQFLYDEWAHPFFVSKEEYGRLAGGAGLGGVTLADWTAPTIASWRHSVWVGVWDPWVVVRAGPRLWYKTVREIVTLERMHRAFADGLMEYGMM